MITTSRAVTLCALVLATAWTPASGVVAEGADAGTFAPPLFVEVTNAVGLGDFLHGGHVGRDGVAPYFVELTGPGACWLDVDRDDDMDLYLVSGIYLTHPQNNSIHDPHSRLYRNDGGTYVEDGGRLVGLYQGCSAADYDNDGWTDLYVLGHGGNTLLRNNGAGGFVDVTDALGVRDATCGSFPCWGASASWFDADRDGCLDLYVDHFGNTTLSSPGFNGPEFAAGQENRFFRGSCGGAFVDVTHAAGLGGIFSNSWSSMAFDLNNDAWPDLYVSNDGDENDVYINDGDGTFTRITNEASDGRNGMGTAVGDINADGLVDIMTTNYIQDTNGIFVAQPEGGYFDIGVNAPFTDALPYSGWSTTFLDVDHDGLVDIMTVNGMTELVPQLALDHPLLLYLNRGGGEWEQARTFTGPAMLLELVARGAAWADHDNDGDLDVLVTEAGPAPTHLLEATRTSGNFLLVDLVGGNGVNRDAIGTRVTVGGQLRERTAGDGYMGSSDPRLHFGLGEATSTTVHVRWPDGSTQTVPDVRANSAIRLTKGSASVETIWTMPMISIAGPTAVQRLAEVTYSAVAVDLVDPIVSWTWTLPGGSQVSGPSASFVGSKLGPQHVILTAVDAAGRETTRSLAIRVHDDLQTTLAPDQDPFLPGQNVTAMLRVLHSDGTPVAGAKVSVFIEHSKGDLDPTVARLPKAARTTLGHVEAWVNGTTDAEGRFRLAVPPNLLVPNGLRTIGTHAPGDYPMTANGEIHGFLIPEARATASVRVT